MLPVLTRSLNGNEYGMIAVFTLVAAVISPIVGVSVAGAVSVRYFEQERFDLASYVSSCLLILFSSTIALTLLLILIGPFLPWPSELNTSLILIACVVSASQVIVQIQLVLLQSAGKPRQYGLLRFFQATIDAGLTLVFVVSMQFSWEGRIGATCLSSMATAVVCLILLKQSGMLKLRGILKYAGDAVRFGAPLVLHSLGGTLIANGDKLLIAGLLSLTDLGIYAVPAQVCMVANLLLDSVFKALHPWIIENCLIPERRLEVVRVIYTTMLMLFIGCIIIFVILWSIFPYYVGDEFVTGRELLLPLLIASVIRCAYYSTAIFINVAGKNEHLAFNTLVSGLISVLLSIILISEYGVVGAAMGVVVGELISFILNFRSSKILYPMPWGLK